MLKIVLLAYSRGIISSRKIEQACAHNVLFIAISGDSQPSYTHIARFVRELGDEVAGLFSQVLQTCERIGLIGKTMLAVDGVKLPANASKERNGTHAQLAHACIATVEPVFANIRHHKGMHRFTLRSRAKVSTEWQLYCMVHHREDRTLRLADAA
jgi:hypothetical protein